MRLKLDWMEFVSAALDGLSERGYEPNGFPIIFYKEGTTTPMYIEIETKKRKLSREISIF